MDASFFAWRDPINESNEVSEMSRFSPCRALLALVLVAAPLGAQQQTGRPVSLNFESARVTDVVRSVRVDARINVVFTDVPDKRISFSTTAPVRPEDLGGVLESDSRGEQPRARAEGCRRQVVPADKAPATGQVRVGAEIDGPAPARAHHATGAAAVHSCR